MDIHEFNQHPIVLSIVKQASIRQREGAIYLAAGWEQQSNELRDNRDICNNGLDTIYKTLVELQSRDSISQDEYASKQIDTILTMLNCIKANNERINGIESYVCEYLRDVVRHSKKVNNEVKETKTIIDILKKDTDYFDHINKLHDALMENLVKNSLKNANKEKDET